jgi:hypothetical protein
MFCCVRGAEFDCRFSGIKPPTERAVGIETSLQRGSPAASTWTASSVAVAVSGGQLLFLLRVRCGRRAYRHGGAGGPVAVEGLLAVPDLHHGLHEHLGVQVDLAHRRQRAAQTPGQLRSAAQHLHTTHERGRGCEVCPQAARPVCSASYLGFRTADMALNTTCTSYGSETDNAQTVRPQPWLFLYTFERGHRSPGVACPPASCWRAPP